jgi:L-amino acid N-acyltransferase YncA
MKLPVQVRTATVTDLPLILEIVNLAILFSTAIYDYEPRSMEVQHSWFEKKQAEGMPVIVAEYDGKVIGFGSYGIFRPWAAYQFSVEHSVYVSESFQRSGRRWKTAGRTNKACHKTRFSHDDSWH